MSKLNFKDLDLSYLPYKGLAPARILARAFKVAWMPAFAIEIVYCSIASCIATWSFLSILSNSSMQHIPFIKY